MFDASELRAQFANPPRTFRVNPMTHGWAEDYRAQMDQGAACGYGGAVTNVPFENGFTSNPANIEKFRDILAAMDEKGLNFWIYDEMGYPSGQGGGLVLEGHPELAAKGFYMHRRIAYEPTHARFRLDDESDKIVWAAKYPVETPGLHESYVRFDRMIPLSFTADSVECDLAEKEVLYVFCVKDAYAGSHSTHNVSSFRKNINIMDKAAVRRFIDLCFEPIAQAIPDAYSRAVNVFTDEPSLHVAYVRDYESWPYALAPWVDGLPEAYEAEYGESIYPQLPLIFEGGTNAYPMRVKFYSLVGKLIAEAYSGQLSAWCEAHGCGFSGHYLIEENISHHVKQYGDFVRVVCAASYPGIDILNCYPEIYPYNVTRYVQMAVRKNHTNGMMVEICPFANVDEFKKDPLNNMTAVMGLLYLGGVRVTNSYFSGYTNEAETIWFNEYVGRLGAMLDGLSNDCGIFVYYGLEDAQAKTKPLYCSGWNDGDTLAQDSTEALTAALSENGFDYYFIDGEDLEEAVRTLSDSGTAQISGHTVKTVLIPKLDVIKDSALTALKTLAEAGIRVRFMERAPQYGAESGCGLTVSGMETASVGDAVEELYADGGIFNERADGAVVLRAKFVREDTVVHMLANKSRRDAVLTYNGASDAELWNPADGSITPIRPGEPVCVSAMRAVFVIYPME
ncbi:MAG: hypothetical protein IKU40_12605 [Clostridia bacterium]|nr:hypothetical protein [Clostridia bacterium]